MGFAHINENGESARRRVVLDCSKDEPLTEQSHKAECDINNIIRKHGIELIQKTALLRSQEFQFDDVTGNDFQEAMHKVMKAQATFDTLPSVIRKEFDHDPAKFLDFIQNPDNLPRMEELGLVQREPDTPPLQVQVVEQPGNNPETPPE